MAEKDEPGKWHLDKRVPISLIIAIAVQTFGAIWWAAAVSAKIDVHDKAIEDLRHTDSDFTGLLREVREALAEIKGALGVRRER